ncbi:MAG: tRNA adenosine(34) deaminase TadA [Syntrophobacteraceae bacterium]
MNSDHFLMGLAIEEAEKAYSLAEVPVGAVLVDAAGRVLARAHNLPVASGDPTAHAEILAIRAASASLGNYRLPGTVLYATLEPCPMCVGAMLHARVSRLVFGAWDPRSGAAGSVVDLTRVASFNHYIGVSGGVRADECSVILKKFFSERRTVK